MDQSIVPHVGVDLGDAKSHICSLDPATGEILRESVIPTTRPELARAFAAMPRCVILMETGTHSSWVARLLAAQGHKVTVAHARRLRIVSENLRKSDRTDAHILAMLAANPVNLVKAVVVRSAQTQELAAVVRARDLAVQTRSKLAVGAKGFVKAAGARLPGSQPEALPQRAWDLVPADLCSAVHPLLLLIAQMTRTIRGYDREIKRICAELRPETKRLTQVHGVGEVTALAYVLSIESASRFARSRDVGAFLGLVPAKNQSGRSNPKLGISKNGDALVRRLLVQCAHQILRKASPDTALKRWGLAYIERHGKGSRKTAATAVARKLAVLLHALWTSGATYEPLRNGAPAAKPGKARGKPSAA